MTIGKVMPWPYPIRYGEEKEVSADVLILGGGIAGCWAAISAARKGLKVVVADKGDVIVSGAGGAGCDHWINCVNPCSKLSAEEILEWEDHSNGGYYNGLSRYIAARESYDTLLEYENLGAKIRDTEDEFKGAAFRDEKTKLLYAYDYENRFTLRIWGAGTGKYLSFKRALYEECRRPGHHPLRTRSGNLLAQRGWGPRSQDRGGDGNQHSYGRICDLPGEGHSHGPFSASENMAFRVRVVGIPDH